MRIDLPLIPVDEPEPCAARVPLFTGLDLEQLRRVSALARPLVLEAGDAPVSYTHLTLPTNREV